MFCHSYIASHPILPSTHTCSLKSAHHPPHEVIAWVDCPPRPLKRSHAIKGGGRNGLQLGWCPHIGHHRGAQCSWVNAWRAGVAGAPLSTRSQGSRRRRGTAPTHGHVWHEQRRLYSLSRSMSTLLACRALTLRITSLPGGAMWAHGTSYQLVWINGWPTPLRMSVAAPMHLPKGECLLSNLLPNTHVQNLRWTWHK